MRSLVLGLLLLNNLALATDLTEWAAVDRALQQPDIATQLEARRALARSEMERVGRWDNPQVEYARETLDTPGSNEETVYLLRQRLNIAGVKGLERQSARTALNATEAQLESRKREIISEIRLLFYQAIATAEQHRTLQTWHQRLDKLTQDLRVRTAAGDTSRYDQARLERELALLTGELLQARSEAESAEDHLLLLVDMETASPTGDLLPPAPTRVVTPAIIDNHPSLHALRAKADSAAIDQKAAKRARWPDITLGLGQREVIDGGLKADGHVVSVAVDIPLFDRAQGEASAAGHRSRLLRAEHALEEHHLMAQARRIQRDWSAQREAAIALQQSNTHSLIPMAEAAFTAGEINAMELIDAYRTEIAGRQALIHRSLAARQAYIQWQTFIGE